MPSGVEFLRLLAAGFVWFFLHAGVAGSGLRVLLVARVGERAYRGGFSLASVAALWWLISEYGNAPYMPLWVTPSWVFPLAAVLVPVALFLFVGTFTVPSPTIVGGEKVLAGAEAARGVLRITRHPFLWGTALWALAHLLVNADAGSWIFFSSLGLTAVRGTFDIDRKRRRTHPEEFARFEAVTSNWPLAALLSGRTRLVPRELLLPILLGLGAAGVSVVLHARLFGAPALPWL